jgi:hypothetical protein
MSAIHKWDKQKIIPKHKMRDIVRYGNGIYTPKRPYYDGNGFMDGMFNFFKDNQDSIQAITKTIGNVADAGSKVSNTVMDIIKRKKELDKMGIEQEALNEIIQSKTNKPQPINKGNGFFYLSK